MGRNARSSIRPGPSAQPISRRLRAAFALAWVLLVLYPRPWDLALTLERSLYPPVDAHAAAEVASQLDDDPVHIEKAVREQIIPYAYDWTVYDEPWYFATVSEALRDGRGDCESQAIVLASILDAKKIPYKLEVSFDHIWVQYPQKKENPQERDAVAVLEHVNGKIRVKAPNEFDWNKFINSHREAHWDPMPLWRKWLLGLGLVLTAFATPSRLRALWPAAWRRATASPYPRH